MSVENIDREVQFRGLSPEQRELLMIQVAKRYYELDMTMGELAKELGLTRWQASRLLGEARETGIVRIEIVPRAPRKPDLESRLAKQWGLRDAVVVPVTQDLDAALQLDRVAQAAARLLAGLGRISLIGVSWGRTMSAVAHHLPPFWNEGMEVVLLNGATTVRSTAAQTNNVAERFAQSASGTATLLPVPAILGQAATRTALENDPTLAGVLAMAARAPVICFGMGAISPDSVLVQSGFLSEAEAEDLQAKGAVGDILSRFIDEDGAIVDADLDARTIGLELSRCRDRDLSIGVAAGRAKHRVVRACLRAGYVNVLVTDEQTALFLLNDADHG
jgi:deoxyribonucleoside regulator